MDQHGDSVIDRSEGASWCALDMTDSRTSFFLRTANLSTNFHDLLPFVVSACQFLAQ